METLKLKNGWLGWVCAGLLAWGGVALAQDEKTDPAGEPVVAEGSEEIPSGGAGAAANAALPVVETLAAETPGAEEKLAPPAKIAPRHRGSDMGSAFKGAGSSRFGVSGRVNKMPAIKSAKKGKDAWKRSLELGMVIASGNSEILRYNGAIEASKETDTNYAYLKAAGRYGESDKEKDVQNAIGEAKVQHRLSERVYSALDGNVLHDPIADLSYRAQSSLSLGRRFVWSERTVLSAEIGPGYVAEKKGGEREGFIAGRAAQYLEFLVTDSLQIWQSVEFVQNLEDSAVYFANAEVGLETVLVSNLRLRFTVEDRYDSNPAEGKESNDLLTTTALAWNF